MRIQKMWCTCEACHEVFDATIVVEAHIDVAVASMKVIRCRSCGSADAAFGGNYTDAPPAEASLAERRAWWKAQGEHGISSATIFAVFTCSEPPMADVPLDPDDFRRCRQLLDLIPEWRPRIGEVGLVYPWYRPFVDRWDEMDRLWDEESPLGSCPKLYRLMSIALNEARSIQETMA